MKALDSSLYKNRVENPEETVYEIITTEDSLGWGLAIADIRRSKPHIHYKTKEFYIVLEGSLKVTLRGKSCILKTGESVEISPKIWHKAEAVGENYARIAVISFPAWRLEDHHVLKEKIKQKST